MATDRDRDLARICQSALERPARAAQRLPRGSVRWRRRTPPRGRVAASPGRSSELVSRDARSGRRRARSRQPWPHPDHRRPPRALHHRLAARGGRHGRGLPGPRRRAAARGGGQDSPGHLHHRSGAACPLRTRSAAAGVVEPSEHRHHSRHRARARRSTPWCWNWWREKRWPPACSRRVGAVARTRCRCPPLVDRAADRRGASRPPTKRASSIGT